MRTLGDIAAVAKRYIFHLWRMPQLLVYLLLQPIMFVLLFRYVFGGAIAVPGGNYVNYLMPGIFLQASLAVGVSTATGLAADLKSGMIDRFRSLPMARSAVLAGRTTADLVRNVLIVIVMIGVAVLVGFRFHGGLGRDLLGVVLVVAMGYAFSWIYATIGLVVKDAEAAQMAGFLTLFPLVFASSAFVPVETMPSWLRGFASHQPVSIMVNACRALFQAQPVGSYLWQAALWILGICVVFIPLAVRMYRRA